MLPRVLVVFTTGSTGLLRDVLPGALSAAFLFELGKAGFVLYIENVAHLKAVYGSLSSIIVPCGNS